MSRLGLRRIVVAFCSLFLAAIALPTPTAFAQEAGRSVRLAIVQAEGDCSTHFSTAPLSRVRDWLSLRPAWRWRLDTSLSRANN